MSTDFWKRQNGARHITPRGLHWPEGEWCKVAMQSIGLGKDIVEFGCGPGRLAGCFDPKRYLGVDINEASIKIAREAHPQYRFKLLDEKAALPECDALLCHTVLLHVADDELEGTVARFTAPLVHVN